MFDIKCINCKFFKPRDGECERGNEEENCKEFAPLKSFDEETESCENCAFYSLNFCDYDLDDPKTCRRFKDKNEDL